MSFHANSANRSIIVRSYASHGRFRATVYVVFMRYVYVLPFFERLCSGQERDVQFNVRPKADCGLRWYSMRFFFVPNYKTGQCNVFRYIFKKPTHMAFSFMLVCFLIFLCTPVSLQLYKKSGISYHCVCKKKKRSRFLSREFFYVFSFFHCFRSRLSDLAGFCSSPTINYCSVSFQSKHP